MNFQRNAISFLENWKNRKRRKPLIIRGARQVGKSTLVEQFSTQFNHFIPLNLERPADIQWFKEYKDLKTLIRALYLEHAVESPENVLLFIDEIQESVEAIKLLRYLFEDFPEIYVIAAGSLLEFALKDIQSFPVGRVEQFVLHPFNFEEYLMAQGERQPIKHYQHIPFENFAYKKLIGLFHTYAMIGGMPEAIVSHIEQEDLIDTQSLYENLWQTYLDDIEKYAANRTERNILRHVLTTAHNEKDRITFEKFGKSNYRSREVGEALRALDMSRLIRLIYPTTVYRPPITSDIRKRPRLQYLDVGLLNHMLNIKSEYMGLKDMMSLYKGRIIHQIVTQELISRHHQPRFNPNFWVREKANSDAEIDLVYQTEKYVIPIEIKSGPQGKLRSLHYFMDHCAHPYAIRLLANEFRIDHVKTVSGSPYLLMNLPYFLAGKIPEYAQYLTEHY